MSFNPPLGWIEPKDRTQTQSDAHYKIVSTMPKFTLAPQANLGPVKVMLTDFWKDPRVTADVGFVFPRFHQLTGSCVGAGGGQALVTLIDVQRCVSASPTKAILPFWGFNYGRSRLRMGDHGRGEGSLGSTFAESLVKDGVISILEQGLPAYKNNDGLTLTSQQEMEWSDGDSPPVINYLNVAKNYPLGTAAPITDTTQMKTAIVNGYPCTFACSRYIGHGSVKGSGDNAVVMGSWDSNGGHQQSVHNYWDHPELGPLFLVLNNWPESVYPTLPNQPVCSTWVTEAKVTEAFRYDSEVYALSHLTWFPAQPEVLDYTP